MKTSGKNVSALIRYRESSYRSLIRILLMLFLICICCITFVNAQNTITMAFAYEPSENPQYLFYERIYTEAFKELGYSFQYKVYPSKRSSFMLNEGKIDGEPQRIYEYAHRYTNVIRVEEPIFSNETIAYAITTEIHVDSLESLKDTKYRVEYLTGSVWSKDNLETLVPSDRLSSVPTISQGFKKLALQRTDLFIALQVPSLEALYTEEFVGSPIMPIAVIGKNLSYPYLHKSHAILASQLAETLKKMKKDGRYNQILKETMPFMPVQ